MSEVSPPTKCRTRSRSAGLTHCGLRQTRCGTGGPLGRELLDLPLQLLASLTTQRQEVPANCSWPSVSRAR